MDELSTVENALSKIMHINGTINEEQIEQSIASCIAETFGIDNVGIKSASGGENSNIYEYIANTKRPYIDNELSEYSSFPELVGYWTKGFRSCALMPVIISGRVTYIIELSSKTINKFSQEMLSDLSTISYFSGLSMFYRKEEAKSLRLSSYFNSAFDNPTPQMLVSNDGAVIRSNPEAAYRFGNPSHGTITIQSIFKTDLKSIREKSRSGQGAIARVGQRIYSVHSSEIPPNLAYIYAKDVTDQERLNSLTMAMDQWYGAGILLINDDANLTIDYATPSIKKITGFDSSLIVSRSILDLVSERERGKLKDTISGLDKSGRAAGVVGMLTDTGTISQVRFTISKLHGKYTMLFYDAGPEKYVESMNSAFNEFLDGASDLAMRVDELGYIRYSNHSAEQVLGYERSELIGKEARLIYADPGILDKNIAFVRSGGKVDNIFATFVGKEKTIEATTSMRMFKTGDSPEYVIIAKELDTKRRAAEQEERISILEKKLDKLTKTGQLKSQFIYNISHELKTPLTNIIGFSKLLYSGDYGDLNETQKEYLSTIVEESDRLMKIIAQILEAAKLDSEKMKLDISDVDLRAMEENTTIRALGADAQAKGISFSWEASSIFGTVQADYGRLIQVFVNLIGNAIKFTPKGGAIRVIITRKMRVIECCVSDTGIGIGEENRKKLFKEFYEAPHKSTIKPEGTGTGLGLSITKKIIMLHGGEIRYEPGENNGSKFIFTLPIKRKAKKSKKLD